MTNNAYETLDGARCDLAASEAVGAPVLKVPCEVYSRIVGYLRPISNWNDGKQQEFAERKPFGVSAVLEAEP